MLFFARYTAWVWRERIERIGDVPGVNERDDFGGALASAPVGVAIIDDATVGSGKIIREGRVRRISHPTSRGFVVR